MPLRPRLIASAPPRTSALLGGSRRAWLALAMATGLAVGSAQAQTTPTGPVLVAVAANFTAPMQQMAADFERETGHRVQLAFGATGKFNAQITQGAPFHVLLSADDTTPARLAQEGKAVADSRFVYAVGRLVLWSPEPGVVDAQGQVLRDGTQRHLAIAQPRVAPYGAAAMQVLDALGVRARWEPRLVTGESIGQAYQFVATGNAPLGFVALSQVQQQGRIARGSAWVVPESLHAPLRQEAVLLKPGQGHAGARALLQYLRTPAAQAVIRAFGYGV